MRFLIPILATLTLPALLSAQYQRESINWDTVTKLAETNIAEPYRPKPTKLPSALKNLSYDDYRNIRFRPSEALWWNSPLPFHVEFFHLGQLFHDAVEFHEISDTHTQEIPFRSDAFDYSESSYSPGLLSQPPGYAGMRVKYPLNRPDVFDDLIVFQGASYFRALGKGQNYGLSLRGLSMNTLGDAEDFPRFTKFWLKKPAPEEKALTLYALLEGQKVAGAYAFTVTPNGRTHIEVKARLFFRDDGASEVGIAPITSLFTFGENTYNPPQDWRPEVHDSDGLLLEADTEWTWHPLDNLPGRNTMVFPCGKLSGFGLLQRDREMSHYKDLEAHYETRPSAWITPKGEWRNGSVVLYTFNTPNETVDNVVAFWRPELPEGHQGPLEIEYSIDLQLTEPVHPLAKVLETRTGQRTLDPAHDTIMIEFSRPETLSENEIPELEVDLRTGSAEILEPPSIQYNAPEDRIRVIANIKRPRGEAAGRPVEMTARLLRQGQIVSEKWNYSWHR